MIVAERCNYEKGDLIDGTYQVLKILGEGTFGRVFLVCDHNGREFALKLLRLWEVHSEIREPLVKRFDMEFETGRIQSEYLVHSLAHGLVHGNPYIVMEYCSGGDLTCLTNEDGHKLPLVAMHVLQGLSALHHNGKVHRDLKPENVLLKKDGKYCLTDFGISGDRNKRMTERNILGKPRQIFGTYAYMPPEQVNPRREATVLPTTDIFSFGVMMYQLIVGSLPFGKLDNEKDLVKYIDKVKKGEWDQVALMRTSQGKQWFPLFQGCLQRNFQDRFQTVEDVMRYVPEGHAFTFNAHTLPDYQTRIVHGILLRVMQGEEYGMVYKLDDMIDDRSSILSLGRRDYGIYNDISIKEDDSSYISRHHCTFELDYNIGNWVVRDGQWDRDNTGGWRSSTNGTFVNSQEVSIYGVCFFPGDIISVGDTKLRVEAY